MYDDGKFAMDNVCKICGREHLGMSQDVGFSLPDVIWTLGPEQRQAHLNWSTDVAHFEGRWFIRGVLELPLQFDDGYFGWGCWAEVNESSIARYREVFSSDGSRRPRESGVLANQIRGYADTIGVPVTIQFRTADKRPAIFLEGANHLLAEQQRRGLTCDEYEEIATSYGLKAAPSNKPAPKKPGLRNLFGRRRA